jgi:hypothetical protein
MEPNFEELRRVVDAFLRREYSVEEAAHLLMRAGFGQNFTVGADSEGDLNSPHGRRLQELMWAVHRLHNAHRQPRA